MGGVSLVGRDLSGSGRHPSCKRFSLLDRGNGVACEVLSAPSMFPAPELGHDAHALLVLLQLLSHLSQQDRDHEQQERDGPVEQDSRTGIENRIHYAKQGESLLHDRYTEKQ